MQLTRAEKPFLFKTQLSLVLMTGMRAKNLKEMRDHLARLPESSVYYHTHHFLQQHQFLTPEPPNDFAYWVTNVLQEDRVGEKLAAIDTVRFNSLTELREAILLALDKFLEQDKPLRECPVGEEFHFMKSVLFNLPTHYVANDLREFQECLRKVSISSLYYHIFTGRLRQPVGINDFSDWLTRSLDEKELAFKVDRLDPYTQTMEGLRQRIIQLIDKRLNEGAQHATVKSNAS
jgi:hypothetical protein